ncbi:MAG: ABC transporter permease, partial [Chitinophagaceae bacterium]
YVGINMKSDVTLYYYFSKVLSSIDFIDIIPATIKSILFGFSIGLIGSYKGFTAANGTESVGKAATSAVVAASLTIFIIDMIVVQITDLFF